MNQSPITQKNRACWATYLTEHIWRATVAKTALWAVLLGAGVPALGQQERVLGLDISAWQGNISQATWNNIHNVENRQFIILRSSRGGTTGYYNQSNAGNDNPPGQNTFSQRYDDPYYVQNINRVAIAGMFAGSYHFSRHDIIAGTLNSGGIANTGTDEADHFIQMAGPWMRPGYLVPVHDFEGSLTRSDDALAQFCIDFSNRIYEKMGIRPAIYIGGSASDSVMQAASSSLRNQMAQPPASLPSVVAPCYPTLWNARWPNQDDPNSIDVQNGEPKDTYSGFYGPWDDYGGSTHPWKFWQYASKLRLQSFNNGGSNLDADVARGGIEFLKDQLIPAVWTYDGSGDWSTLTNWNSGRAPVAPVPGPGQVTPVGTQTLPTARLPGAAGSGVTSGQHDTVILERPNANITVTLSTGTHNIRKLYMRETLNIVGGSLTVNYAPSADSTTNGAQFSGSVTLSNSASFSVHTLQVDTNRVFTLAGGTLTLNTINLMPHASAPAKILMNGDVTFNALSNVTAVIAKGAGAGSSGFIDLSGGARAFNVGNGTNAVDLSIDVPITNGALIKSGAGTMRFTSANTYANGTTLSAGRLFVNNSSGSGTGNGGVAVNGGILGGTGTIAGVVTVNSGGTISPGTSIGTLTLNSAPTFNGTNFMEINRNGGSALADKIVLTSGTLNYGGTLVVSNAGATLTGGEVFTNFAAGVYSGAFAATILPTLNGGLNWYTGMLTTNGTIRVNRSPVANPVTFTNEAPIVLQIPIASLTANDTDADGDTITLTGINLTTTNGITLLTNNTFIFYSNYVSVSDQFSYTLSDGHGGSATGAVHIASSPAGRFTDFPSGSGNSVTLHFAGRPGWSYYLERSTNLAAWATIWTNVAPASGVFEYADDFHDLTEPASTAFYRLRWLP